jgi:chaperonin GroES
MSTLVALHDKVILKKVEEEANQMVGGIIVPDTGKEKSNYFTVVSVGVGMYDPNTGKSFPMYTKEGDTVIVPKAVVTQIIVDGDEYYVCREVEILSIIKD